MGKQVLRVRRERQKSKNSWSMFGCQRIQSSGSGSTKDGNYLYVEFYGMDELYAEVIEKLGPALRTGTHDIMPEAFCKMVDLYAEHLEGVTDGEE